MNGENMKKKKRYIDDLYTSRGSGQGFYGGDGTSHRPKKDVIIRKKHIVIALLLAVFIIVGSVAVLVYNNELSNLDNKVFNPTDADVLRAEKEEEKSQLSATSSSTELAPWFSIDADGILYFHTEYFEGTHLAVPKRFNGVVVEKLDGESFSKSNSKITTLTVHEGVQFIGESAFSKFSKLTEVNLPSTLVRCGADSFSGTPWYKSYSKEFLIVGKGVLIKYNGNSDVVAIPESTCAIDGAVFEESDAETIIIPNATTYIGSHAFKNCKAEDIVFSKNVAYVERDAFQGSVWLENRQEEYVIEGAGVLLKCNTKDTTIRVPENVKMISNFETDLPDEDITLIIGAAVSKISDIEALGRVKAFKVDERNQTLSAQSGVLYNASGTTLFRYPIYKQGSAFYLPDEVLKIGNYAFSDTTLEKVEMYDGMLIVSDHAFKNCKKLKSIAIPDTVTSLGVFAFEGCESLKTATVSESIKNLPHGLFKDCEKLKSATISEYTSSIAPFSFKGCQALPYFYITKNISYLSPDAFDSVKFAIDSDNPHYELKNGKPQKKAATATVDNSAHTNKVPFS